MRHRLFRPLASFTLLLTLTATTSAQRGGPPQPPPTPRAQAAFDITGYWVSLVNEDWRYRIATPPKGDFAGVPLNGAGRHAADAWDPDGDALLVVSTGSRRPGISGDTVLDEHALQELAKGDYFPGCPAQVR